MDKSRDQLLDSRNASALSPDPDGISSPYYANPSDGYGRELLMRDVRPRVPRRQPVFTVAPSISGTAQEGQTFTADPGKYQGAGDGSGDLAVSYVWERSGTPIGGATSATYDLVLADVGETITVVVTLTGTKGLSASAESDPTDTVIAA